MSLDTLLNSDTVCPTWRDKINAAIAFCNGLSSASSQFIPVGGVIEWEGNIADNTLWDSSGNGVSGSEMQNFALCMGQALTGATAKNADGSTRSNAPDRRGTFSVMLNGTDVDFASIGGTGGTKEETLTALQSGMRDHLHQTYAGSTRIQYDNGTDGGSPNYDNTLATVTGTVLSIDGTPGLNGAQEAIDAHNNLPPFYVVAKIIRYK
jgi:hypothetical protein